MDKITDYIKQNIDILDIAGKLNIQVNNHKAICFNGHDNKTPSLSFKPTENFFKCFGCNVKGSNIDLVMQYLKIDFKQALKWFETHYNINCYPNAKKDYNKPIKHTEYKTINNPDKTHYRANTSDSRANKQHNLQSSRNMSEYVGKKDGKKYSDIYKYFIDLLEYGEAFDYMKGRGISQEITFNHYIKTIPKNNINEIADQLKNKYEIDTLKQAGLFNENNNFIFYYNRLISPYFDIDNYTILGLEGRNIDDKNPKIKTLWLKNINKILYNPMALQDAGRNGKKICICEGIPDVLSIYQSSKWNDWGQPIGIAGTAQGKTFINNLLDKHDGYKVFVATDGDNSGNNFYDDFQKEYIDRFFKECEHVLIPEKEDLNSLLQKGVLK